MTQSPNHSEAAPVVVYCNGCNERLVSADGICSRCGAVLDGTNADHLQETLLVHDWHGEGTYYAEPNEEFDALLGSELSVYQLESLIGSGGMGRVYLAKHRDLGRNCALKILSPRSSQANENYVGRFMNEGRATAALVHPNVVTIHAIGAGEGFHFLEMEFVAGRSLQRLLRDENRLTPVRATALAATIAEGLACAHHAGIVHRDLKPDNVLLNHQGIAKIADFGLAKRVASKSHPHVPHDLAGTPNFMAAELFQGEPACPASDVYALGVCYFLMLSGRLPFVATTVEELMSQVATEPLPNIRSLCPRVSLEMGECLSLLLAKSPRNRPRDGIEAAQLLRAVLGQTRDIESLLTEAFAGDPSVCWTREGHRYQLVLDLPDGRRQTLFIESSDHAASERLLLIYSTCCDADSNFYESALRLNSEIPHGGLAIREIDGRAKFVMVDTYPRATVDVEEIRRSILEVASRADAIERRLTGRDEH